MQVSPDHDGGTRDLRCVGDVQLERLDALLAQGSGALGRPHAAEDPPPRPGEPASARTADPGRGSGDDDCSQSARPFARRLAERALRLPEPREPHPLEDPWRLRELDVPVVDDLPAVAGGVEEVVPADHPRSRCPRALERRGRVVHDEAEVPRGPGSRPTCSSATN